MNYEKLLSSTVQSLKPSGIRRFFDIASTMQGVISLGVGEPDFPTPWEIRKAGIRSLENGKTRYTSNRGLESLCREVSAYTQRKYGFSYDPASEIMISVGGSEGIDAAIRALVTTGDEVIIPQPSYVCYEPLVKMAGGCPVILETTSEFDFKLTPEMLRSALTPKTKMLILPYPCNPTGAIMEQEDLEALAGVLKNTDVIVLSDEIYAELTFGGKNHASLAAVPGMKERTIVVNGFSKTFSMTGWRLGYACAPAPIMRQMIKIHQFAIMCAPTTSQFAAIEALRNGDDAVLSMKEEYDLRRRLIVRGFNELGLSCREPKGAFYAFPSIQSTRLSSEEFCEKLLYAEKVAVVPGTAFGRGGEGYIRASYCYSTEHISEALRRIGHFLKSLT